ncbi:hypothetical protein H4R18_003944 [Coemansia javaensis]|uniref:BZIP domain-containing protein n=1 Tax=Coemansia javaensis TaxID=2761396 RepID=A0A9W8H5L6_9FUNG|nr:hypothetical protein H4R18_003944 [Coemansia javaensis]
MYSPHTHAPPHHWQHPDPPHYAPHPSFGHPPAHPHPHPHPHPHQHPHPHPHPHLHTQAPLQPTSPSAPAALAPARQSAEPKRQRGGRDSVGSDKACSSDEAARILEERRRRNASASARFRKRRNERERELALRCVFLENQLQQALGQAAFDAAMRQAPPVERSLLSRHSQGCGNNDDDDGSPSPVSVCALTAPKSIDDVWAAYLHLSEQLAAATERIDVLEHQRV